MIILEVIHSIDTDLSGEYSFGANIISLGKSKESTLVINDDINGIEVVLEAHPKGVIIHSAKKDICFYSKGKKISGSKLHKIGDKFKIGTTEFLLKKYEVPDDLNPVEELKQKMLKLQNDDPSLFKLFLSVREELERVEGLVE